MCFNNLFNTSTRKFSNKICYKFKIKKAIYVAIAINKNLDKNTKKQLDYLEVTRFRYCQKIVDAILYASLLFKIRYNFMYVFLLLKTSKKVFLRLYRDYILFSKYNKKLNN